MIDLIDYGGGNLGSIRRCLERLDIAYQQVNSPEQLSGEHPIILPGVGAFAALMDALRQRQLVEPLKQKLEAGTPYLGICVGHQILFDTSDESFETEQDKQPVGLGLVSGKVVKFDAQRVPKIPQIGWNHLEAAQERTGLPEGYVYFVNSYYGQPENTDDLLYTADYKGAFCAAVQKGNMTGFQFHPEKSGAFGHQLVSDWVERAYAV